ncbi:uncharacterized protein LOC126334791 isoform X2 [Schistocerca gregaria]|uniref:uncharacterized protein LOC126334791 isoform X2 n=1 Tax=Schistocerca gregaria TaxID=7010 RepID=UPI00211F3208|nr:uncharacterized protein LOC126334791 isoform X2 [Schistocerca gregaria]
MIPVCTTNVCAVHDATYLAIWCLVQMSACVAASWMDTSHWLSDCQPTSEGQGVKASQPGCRTNESKCVTANASTSRTPQFKFMQYAELEAAWWRLDTTKRDISQLPLEQRAKIITSQIIADFVQWQKNFLASEIPILSENVLAELFEVDFDKPIAHALCIHLREIPYVTPMVAKENAMPELLPHHCI